jgi:uncharacterized membrane protein YeaQ/YmgE (transglycosylase-associated protein family)
MDDTQHTMLGPTVIFAFVIATLMGALFHLFVGGNARRLALFLLAGWIGFALGHLGGKSLGITVFPIGELLIIPAVIGALFTLITAFIFTSERRRSSR